MEEEERKGAGLPRLDPSSQTVMDPHPPFGLTAVTIIVLVKVYVK